MEDVGLVMRWQPKLELVFHIGYSCLFLSLYEDVEIAIKRLKTKHPIFFVEHRDYDLVLD